MTVIFLNGCTSAGKSSLAAALQDRLPGLWLRTGIDHAIAMAPSALHHAPEGFVFSTGSDGLLRLDFGPSGRALLRAHQRAAAALLGPDTNLVLDEVLVEPWMLQGWLGSLVGHDVWMIAVHCDLDELERREIARGDRRLGQARGQSGRIHAGVSYDIEVDSTRTGPDALADSIAARLASGATPSAWSMMQSRSRGI
jgi:chloramphenicol 3-O phosphotransferase